MTQNSKEYQESINYSEYLPKYPGSPIEFPGYIFIPENNNYTEFDLFTTFLITCEPQILNVDNFARSIRNKAVAVKLAYNEVLKQVPNWIKENEAAKHFGFTIGVQGVLLAIKYEVYLNSIYSLCGNISFFVSKLYEKGLSNRFIVQRKQFLNDKKNLDESYSNILEKAAWYDEVHSIRSEATHFLTGLINPSDSNEPCYLYKGTYNGRNDAPEKINIKNVETHVMDLQRNLEEFLNDFSKHFRETKFNKDISVKQPCLITDERKILFRSITLDDYLNQRPRKCNELEFDCPHKEKCGSKRDETS
jgi:glutaredoxin-related protein